MTLRRTSFIVIVLLLFFSSDSFKDGTIVEDQPPPHLQQPHYWLKIKALFTNAQSYLFPPNLEGSISNDEGIDGNKVTEAVAKSLGKCKATVEESAKSAAKKLKDTLSSQPHHEPQDL